MIPSKCWPIAFQFDEPENVVIKADSTDNMSSAGNDAAKILNQGIEEDSKFKYKADDVMEKSRICSSSVKAQTSSFCGSQVFPFW